jgi:hypothetical protein
MKNERRIVWRWSTLPHSSCGCVKATEGKTMSRIRVLGKVITYSSPGAQRDIVYFAPYEDTLYRCTQCHQEFAAGQEDLLYRKVRDVRKVKHCPTCHTPLWQCLVEQRRIPWRDIERLSLDEEMRARGYTMVTVVEEVLQEFLHVFSDWE